MSSIASLLLFQKSSSTRCHSNPPLQAFHVNGDAVEPHHSLNITYNRKVAGAAED